MKIAVLMGGDSSEREVSIKSGTQVRLGLERLNHDVICLDPADGGLNELALAKPDVVFLALHGGKGENGAIQGALELMGLPYTGSGVLASALAMDKAMSKRVFNAVGIRTPGSVTVNRADRTTHATRKASEEVGVPCVVKPSCQGSTVGIGFVKRDEDLMPALEGAFSHGPAVLVEQFIAGTEVTVGVLESPVSGEPEALPVLEIVAKNEYYDYDAKYTPGKSDHIIPARINPEAYEECQSLAVRAHTALGCSGYSRVDIIVDPSNTPWVLELNTLPGLTQVSLLPDAAKAAGIGFDELLSAIITAALR
jgi:D-alanine-D-alanine ligase